MLGNKQLAQRQQVYLSIRGSWIDMKSLLCSLKHVLIVDKEHKSKGGHAINNIETPPSGALGRRAGQVKCVGV